MLNRQTCKDFPDQPVYVMSDVDVYYEKLGYRRDYSIGWGKLYEGNTYI